MAGLLSLAFAVLALALACGGGSASDKPGALGPAEEPTLSAVPEATETPVPAEENRQDCDAINASVFLSVAEATWFGENCAYLDGPPVPAAAGQVAIGDKLLIPKAGVNTTVSRATVPQSGQMPDPVGYFNAVWYDFSNLPGFGGYANFGNLILSGHVDCARCHNGGSGTAIFWSVRNLREGDTAQYQLADGRMIDYVVVMSKAFSPTANWDEIVGSSAADMTLITCTGTFSGGDYSQRHVVALKKVV